MGMWRHGDVGCGNVRYGDLRIKTSKRPTPKSPKGDLKAFDYVNIFSAPFSLLAFRFSLKLSFCH
jgi:hypothetical protein